jgi:hypothetical protein
MPFPVPASSSQGIRRNDEMSILARISRYPLDALLTESSWKYVRSCMSQPKITEQKPKPSRTTERNFFLDTILPTHVSAVGWRRGKGGTSKHPVCVDARQLDFVVILELGGDGLDRVRF